MISRFPGRRTWLGWLALVPATLLVSGELGAQNVERRLAYEPQGMAGVVRTTDIVYRSLRGSADTLNYGWELQLDTYRPPNLAPGERRPAVVFVHGGLVAGTKGERPKEWPSYQAWGRAAAAMGLIGVTFVHRLTTEDNADVASGDVDSLLVYVRAHAGELRVDPERICIAVYSAGGPLASPFLREPRPWIRCLVLFYPFLDMAHAALRTPFRDAHPPARVAEVAPYSAAFWLGPNADRLPPIFVARGGRDAIPGINASIERFVFAATVANVDLELHIHRTGPHGLDMVAAPDPRSAEIVQAALAFMQRKLSVPRR